MQKEPDRPRELMLPQVARHGYQVVVVHPDRIAGLHSFQELPREQRIHGLIRVVVSLFVPKHFGEVMKQRPKRAVAVAVVVILDLLLRQIDGGVFDVPLGDDLRIFRRLRRRLTAPSQPHAAGVPHRCAKPHGQPARAGAVTGQLNPIRDTNQAFHR